VETERDVMVKEEEGDAAWEEAAAAAGWAAAGPGQVPGDPACVRTAAPRHPINRGSLVIR